MPITLENPRVQPPASGNPPKQLVILLHGYGSNADDLISLAPQFAHTLPEAVFVSPNAPFPCEINPMGYQWFSLLEYTLPFMEKGANEALPILNQFIDQQLEYYGLTEENLILVGFSQGTMMSLHSGLRKEKPIAGILGYSGALLDTGNLADEIASRPPICLVHGQMDNVVPHSALTDARNTLESLDLLIETHSRPYLGHGIDPEGISIGNDFLSNLT